jgi:hypothetical protein
MNNDLLMHLININVTMSSILAAIIAFMFSARNSLRGKGLAEIETVYKEVIFLLIVIFSFSTISFVYFFSRMYFAVSATHIDFFMTIIVALTLPLLALIWIVLYKKY